MTRLPVSVPWLARNDVRLFLTSAAILFVELLLIRWIPANVRYIGFFSNFLLIASFLGIGLGILLGRNGRHVSLSVFAVLLLLTVGLVIRAQLNVQVQSDDELFFGLAESGAADVNFLVLPLVVILVAAVLAALAMPLGPLLRSMPPLKAYGIDIAGSLVGIAGFTLLSAVGTGPMLWFIVVAVLLVLLMAGSGLTARSAVGLVAMAMVLFAVQIQVAGRPGEVWSPYYRISTYQDQIQRTHINVNGIPHQALHEVEAGKEEFYEQIYQWFPGRTYERVLVVGAGSGSDVALALA
ncbi:MAG: hypothetical protein WKF38_03835, partial [Candidatus Limnocylindrales bacterium]